ncbi:hypothetical protein FB446DRAFT_706453 [Lentinula raphanica]|nr:hypothetical protein FB446DRAFT_706453 [Lentinula raphanica]
MPIPLSQLPSPPAPPNQIARQADDSQHSKPPLRPVCSLQIGRKGPDGQWLRIDATPTAADVMALVIGDESFDLPSILSNPWAAQKVDLEASLWSGYFVSLDASAHFGSEPEMDAAFESFRDINKLKKKCKRPDADFVDSSDYVDCAQKYSRQFVHPDDLQKFNKAWKTYKFKRIQDLARDANQFGVDKTIAPLMIGGPDGQDLARVDELIAPLMIGRKRPDGQWLRIDSTPTATDVTALIIRNDFFDLPSLQSNPRTAQKVHLATRLWLDYFVYLDASVHFVSVGKKTSTFQFLRDIVQLGRISERPTGFASNLDYITCALWYMKVYGGVKYAEHRKMDKVWKTYMASMPSPQPAPPGSAQIEQTEQLASVSSPQPAPPGPAQIEQLASEFDPQASHSQGPVAMRSNFKLRLGRVRNSDGTWASKTVPHSLSVFTYVLLFDDQERFDFPSISDLEDVPKEVPIPKRQGTDTIAPQFYWYLGTVRFPGNEEKKLVFETLGNFDKLKTECQEDEIRDSFEHAACALNYITTAGYIDIATFSKKWPAIVAERGKDLTKKAEKDAENKDEAAARTAEAQSKSALAKAASNSKLKWTSLRVGRVWKKNGDWVPLNRREALTQTNMAYVVLFGETTFDFPSIYDPEHPLEKTPILKKDNGQIDPHYYWPLMKVIFLSEEERHSVLSVVGNLQELGQACGKPITDDFVYADCFVIYIKSTKLLGKRILSSRIRWDDITTQRQEEIDAREAKAADTRAVINAAFGSSKSRQGAKLKPKDPSVGPSGGESSGTSRT